MLDRDVGYGLTVMTQSVVLQVLAYTNQERIFVETERPKLYRMVQKIYCCIFTAHVF